MSKSKSKSTSMSQSMYRSKPIAHHATCRLEEDRPLAPTPVERRVLARVLLHIGGDAGLLAFYAADTHMHVLTALARAETMELMRRVEIALQRRLRLGSPFERARPKPIYSQWHLGNALRYIHSQGERHGLLMSHLWEATSLPDLLEMRPLGSYLIARVRGHLPRLTRGELLAQAGLASLEPAWGPCDQVIEATCRAAALPHLSGSGQEVLAARRVALEVLLCHLDIREAQALLGLTRVTTSRLMARSPDPALLRAVTLVLGSLAATGGSAGDRVAVAGSGALHPPHRRQEGLP